MGRRETKPGQRIAEQLAANLRSLIVDGQLAPGEPLPSERDLAEQFDVNRSSVREALHRLDAIGLIEMRHGGATRVRDLLVSAGLHVLPLLVVNAGRIDRVWLKDLLDVRTMLLAWCGEQAARKATSKDVEHLERIVADLVAAHGRPRELSALDWEFFEVLVEITQNRVLQLLSNVVREVHAQHASKFGFLYAAGTFDCEHHRRAAAAVRARDPAAAAAAMREHGESPVAALQARR